MATINVKDAAGSTVALEKPLAAGQAAMAASRPVVIASDQSAVPVMVSTINSVAPAFGSGTVGATVQRMTLATDSPGVTTAGQTTKSASLPVTMASDQDPAHDAVDSGVGPKQTGKATTSLAGLTLVANADRTDLFAGVDGVRIVRPHCNLEDIVSGNATNTDGTSTQCIAAQAAGVKTYLSSIVLCNTSATAITVDIKDGTTVKVSLPLPAGSGCVYNPPVPIPGTAATAWNFDGSAAATTVTCSMVGFKSKV